MFWQIFLFEVQNRLRRPAVYIYFSLTLAFITFTFATGSLPVGEKEHINSPILIAFALAYISIFMMLVTSAIMGMPLYKDIEYSTKDYYLTYPITKAGYFWGRYFSSLLFVLIISSAVLLGVLCGSKLGPLLKLNDPSRYGPNNWIYYIQPYFMIAVPNLIFTSSIFYGLVAITRNIKVIYSSGIILFSGYLISSFFLVRTNNQEIINLVDPFAVIGITFQRVNTVDLVKNVSLIHFNGLLLLNRIIWPGIGLLVLIFSYLRFNFEDFFSGARDKAKVNTKAPGTPNKERLAVSVSFSGSYNRRTLWGLVRTELTNIVTDNYFWLIILCGIGFMGLFFWKANGNYGVPDLPRTVMLFEIFNDMFPLFIFFIIMFYTGETVHRDRITRYGYINDSLPMPNWVLNGSRLIALLILGLGLALLPVLISLTIQLSKGFTQFNFPIYLTEVFGLILPRFMLMVVFAYFVHVVINNKFAALGAGIGGWVILFFLHSTGIFHYNLLCYAYTPGYNVSDMDGLGHMATPVFWFTVYWLLAGGLLIIIAALFYYRGISSSFKERLQLIAERFDRNTQMISALLLVGFLVTGAFIYYNVSYVNNFLTNAENDQRAVAYERKLKPYERLPQPTVTAMKLMIDLTPSQQQAKTHAFITAYNKTRRPIINMLLDGDELTDYTLKSDGKLIPFTTPLLYPQGKFNLFRSGLDTAEFRLYQLSKPLMPGDSMVFEINSSISYKGFQNGSYGTNILNNGTFFKGGLPGLGYDEGDELGSPYERKENHLPPRIEHDISQNDPAGFNALKAGGLFALDITVSVPVNQTAIAPGTLVKQWRENGRSYFHYIVDKPGLYPQYGILSANYSMQSENITLDNHQVVKAAVYYEPAHKANIARFLNAFRDGLPYYSKAYGAYPYKEMRLVETGVYGPKAASFATLDTYTEETGWNANFKGPDDFDYCYYLATQSLAQQWWRFQTAPNKTVGSLVISEGLPAYDALVMAEMKYGRNNMNRVTTNLMFNYIFRHNHGDGPEHPLIKANEWYEYTNKAGIALYGLRDLIGEDNMNAALSEFKTDYAFKSQPPYAGSNDLYRYLQKHTPDSVKYYLTDTWEKITFYDNKVISAKADLLKNNQYKVTLQVSINKSYVGGNGNDIPAQMDDYVDIGIFTGQSKNNKGETQTNPLYLKRHKFMAGKHTITIVVQGKPESVGIDPYMKLIDRTPNDNLKNIEK
jgi:ABC-2 type transport system permease protein